MHLKFALSGQPEAVSSHLPLPGHTIGKAAGHVWSVPLGGAFDYTGEEGRRRGVTNISLINEYLVCPARGGGALDFTQLAEALADVDKQHVVRQDGWFSSHLFVFSSSRLHTVGGTLHTHTHTHSDMVIVDSLPSSSHLHTTSGT